MEKGLKKEENIYRQEAKQLASKYNVEELEKILHYLRMEHRAKHLQKTLFDATGHNVSFIELIEKEEN